MQCLTTKTAQHALYNLLTTNRRSKEDMIRAAGIEGGFIFRNNTYFLEGDGPLIFVAFDKDFNFFFIENTQWPSADALIESIVSKHLHPAVETPR